MAKNKSKGLPLSRSLDELVEFFDTRDMGEYWEQMPEAHFDIDIKRRTHLVAIDGLRQANPLRPGEVGRKWSYVALECPALVASYAACENASLARTSTHYDPAQ